MLAIGLKLASSNLDELERRMKELEKVEASVGNTKGNKRHPTFDGSYNELFWLQHSGSSKAKIPPRPIAMIAKVSFQGEDLVKKGLDKYFSNLDKKGGVISAEEALKPFLKGLYEYSYNIFGDNTFLTPNAPYTVKMKDGRDTPLVDTGALRDAWGIMINNQEIK